MRIGSIGDRLNKNQPFRFVEPTVVAKRKHMIGSRMRKDVAFDIQEIKSRLKEIRKDSIESMDALIESTIDNLNKYHGVNASYAENADEAVTFIFGVAGGISNFAVNNSSAINELMPQLRLFFLPKSSSRYHPEHNNPVAIHLFRYYI